MDSITKKEITVEDMIRLSLANNPDLFDERHVITAIEEVEELYKEYSSDPEFKEALDYLAK